jgi:hypothetical protein
MGCHVLDARDAAALELKRRVVGELLEAMDARGIRKAEMCRRLRTSRAYFDRVLSLNNTTLSLYVVCRAFAELGLGLEVRLVRSPDA